VHTNDVAQIAVPPENRAEHVVKFVERHLSRLLGSPDPRLFGALLGRNKHGSNRPDVINVIF
jgi:hypothetical protein